jgi:hypothetical protein
MFAKIYRTSIATYPFSEKETQIFALRTIKYFLVWFLIWQDNSVEGSPLQLVEQLRGAIYPIHPFEFILLLCFLTVSIERVLLEHYTVKRSYFYAPLILIGLALFVSWARGVWIKQEVAIVYEVHEAFLTPFEFFIFLNLFREPYEWRVIILLLITASVAKSFDGVAIYFFAPAENKSWGTLLLWRDGYLLALGISAMVLLLHYKGKILNWLKWAMIYTTPVIIMALITSYRRTFFVAILVNILLMFLTVGKGKRLKHLGIFFSLLIGIFIVVLATDPIGFITRVFSGVLNTAEEGSAYIRLMEYPNVLMNIYHNPIFGTAVGTQWHQYYRMPLFANFTTIGTHNSYLYWPLRTGIFGTFGFWWMIARMAKTIALQLKFTNSTEDKFFAQISLYMLITYMVGSFFGLMYGDVVTIIIALHLTSLQLFIEERLGTHSIKNVRLFRSLRSGNVTFS